MSIIGCTPIAGLAFGLVHHADRDPASRVRRQNSRGDFLGGQNASR